MLKSILITGANGGIGKDCARQLALLPTTEKIYLGCRNPERAEAAKRSLEEITGKQIFEIILIDVSNLDSVRRAVRELNAPVEGLVMNAGGMGGKTPGDKTVDGVTQQFASNVLGHVVLLDEMLKAQKLTRVALYAGSEAARGVGKMGMKRPKLKTSSADEFASICDGSFFGSNLDPMVTYGYVKYMAAMWMGSMSRKYPNIRFVTMSPGGTGGTDVMDDLPPFMKFMFKNIGLKLMPMFGLMHDLDVGTKRFVDGLNDESFETGMFYGSKKPVLTGPLVDQAGIFSDLANQEFQDHAHEAIHRFIA